MTPDKSAMTMPELFDLKKHKFGMAYNIPYNDEPVYIYDLSRSGASGYGIPVNRAIGQCKPILAVHLEAATRAPEHDMVKMPLPPMGDVVEAVEAAKKWLRLGHVMRDHHVETLITAATQRSASAELGKVRGEIGVIERVLIEASGYTKGDTPSDGTTLCAGCWDGSDHDTEADNDIPKGEDCYFSTPHPEYGDCDAYCRKCTIERGLEYVRWTELKPAIDAALLTAANEKREG